MNRSTAVKAALLAPSILALAGFGSSGPAAQSQSPSVEGCGQSGPRIDQGQTGILLGENALRVDVPDSGTFFSLPGGPGSPDPALYICHVESESSIVIDPLTAEEISRTVGEASGAAVLDQLAGNARIEPAAPSGMIPPRTGDGGLKIH